MCRLPAQSEVRATANCCRQRKIAIGKREGGGSPGGDVGRFRDQQEKHIRARHRGGDQKNVGQRANGRNGKRRVAADSLAQHEDALRPEASADACAQQYSLKQRHERTMPRSCNPGRGGQRERQPQRGCQAGWIGIALKEIAQHGCSPRPLHWAATGGHTRRNCRFADPASEYLQRDWTIGLPRIATNLRGFAGMEISRCAKIAFRKDGDARWR